MKSPQPVVSVQGDDDKIVAGYEDGTIACFDVKTRAVNFELQGRSSLISTVQFDSARLIADGTSTIVVTHDFSDPPEEPQVHFNLFLDFFLSARLDLSTIHSSGFSLFNRRRI